MPHEPACNSRTRQLTGPLGKDAMNTLSNPSDLHAFVLKLADELAHAGMPEAAEALRAAATVACTTGSEWLGELGLAVREVQKKYRPPSALQGELESVMSVVRVAWPQM